MKTNIVSDAELATFARRTNELYRRLTEGTLPANVVLGGLQGLIENRRDSVVIDCDLPISHHLSCYLKRKDEDQLLSRVCGKVTVDPANPFGLFLAEGQQGSGRMTGHEVLAGLRSVGAPVYGIAALNQFLEKGLIPESMRDKSLFAWGDILHNRFGSLFVQNLDWVGGTWCWCDRGVDGVWRSNNPAAVSASSP